MTAWFGFFVPRDTPADVVGTLHAKIRAIIDSPEVQARLVEVGVEPASMSASQFEAFVAAERRKYGEFLAELNIKGD
jgi:tripartite-type tricarboxylate transporter receptor subunit TctC